MNWLDSSSYSWQALARHKVRTLLLLLAVAIGVASVLILTSLGEGAKRFIEQEFNALGNQVLIILPGKKETTGGSVPIYGTSPRDLTIEDANAIAKISTVKIMAPIIAGTTLVSYQSKSREVITLGSTQAIFPVRKLTIGQGKALPKSSDNFSSPVCVLGAKIKQELFGNNVAIGEWVRFSGQRFRVIGILAERGESMGLDLREMAIIPIRSAESLFNSPSLFRILLELNQTGSEIYTEEKIRQIIAKRHDGEDDISILSQNALMSSFSNILTLVTASIGAIAAISLVVAGFLIMNVSYVSVSRRREEIGLLKAIGATAKEVRQLFLIESFMLVSLGVIAGTVFGYGVVTLASYFWPDFPLAIPWWSPIASSSVALAIGLLFSWLPASYAARQDPVLALRGY
ncbi:ABC transporter permease [Candidatus Colwellia aromaticivorans]|uniref:ABC transporter permease n=1 Tax=Candidatus Colwellia aromaticivorans TaxID=2267621 RepID=UPI000DF2705B|nr:ABC transporter permease [Candidatus Colwellia aromaticivorans]